MRELTIKIPFQVAGSLELCISVESEMVLRDTNRTVIQVSEDRSRCEGDCEVWIGHSIEFLVVGPEEVVEPVKATSLHVWQISIYLPSWDEALDDSFLWTALKRLNKIS